MSAFLDDGENLLVILRGKQIDTNAYTDRSLAIEIDTLEPAAPRPTSPVDEEPDAYPTADAPGLPVGGREWYVALALAEPWLRGDDDYPRPPTNREIYERVLHWHGYAWNLEAVQRVDDAIRRIALVAFGPHDDPFHQTTGRRASNIRFAVARRAAEVRLVTTGDLERVGRGVVVPR